MILNRFRFPTNETSFRFVSIIVVLLRPAAKTRQEDWHFSSQRYNVPLWLFNLGSVWSWLNTEFLQQSAVNTQHLYFSNRPCRRHNLCEPKCSSSMSPMRRKIFWLRVASMWYIQSVCWPWVDTICLLVLRWWFCLFVVLRRRTSRKLLQIPFSDLQAPIFSFGTRDWMNQEYQTSVARCPLYSRQPYL